MTNSSFQEIPWYEKPVMIWGVQKTGTTLLKDLLDGHSNLLMYPIELKVTYFFHGRHYQTREQFLADYRLRNPYALSKVRDQYKNIANVGMSKWQWRTELSVLNLDKIPQNIWNLNEREGVLERLTELESQTLFDYDAYYERFRDILSQKFVSARELFMAEIQSIASATQKDTQPLKMWGFKDVGGNPELIHTYFSHFLQGKVIYIYRDPRGGYASQLDEWTRYGKRNSLRHLYYLSRHYEAAFQAFKIYGPEKMHMITYEDLVQKPEEVMQGIAQFLNINYEPILTQTTRFGYPTRVYTATKSSQSPVFNSSIDKWKTKLNVFQVWMVEAMCNKVFNSAYLSYKPRSNYVMFQTLNICRMTLVLIYFMIKRSRNDK